MAQGGSVAARERPFYREVLELRERLLRDPDARVELELRLEDWSADGYGLDGPEPDRVLASATALVALASTPEWAVELRAFLAELGGRLEREDRPDPDLALALASGWLALVALPLAESIPPSECERELRTALRTAEAIDASDARDSWGSNLAHELHRQLRATGRGGESIPMLERALASFPGDAVARPFLLVALADELRVESQFGRAWNCLADADRATEALRLQAPSVVVATLDRVRSGTRCQLEIAAGLLDRAALSLERERQAIEAGAGDLESRLDWLLNLSGVALATASPGFLQRAAAALEEVLSGDGPLTRVPAFRAQLRVRAAIVMEMREDLQPVPEPRSPALLAEAFGDAALDEAHRSSVGMRLIAQALRSHDLDAAEGWLARMEKGPAAARPPELAAALVAARARLALERRADPSVLRARDAELEHAYAAFLEAYRSIPPREGGLGFLAWRNRCLLLGTLVDLTLALEGEDGAEHAIDRLLPEQALGSLARRLGCTPGRVSEVRSELLHEDVGLLLYLPGWSTTHLFVLEAHGAPLHLELAWEYGLESLPHDLARALARSPAGLAPDVRAAELEHIHELARALSARLLPTPVLERMRAWRGAYVVGSEGLDSIPFECLLGLDAQNSHLALAYLPSLPVGLAFAHTAQRARPHDDLELLLVTAPLLAPDVVASRPGLVPLPLGPEEVGALCAGLERTLVLTGSDASWSRIVPELKARRPGVLHFLVHGVEDPERELPVGLALAPSDADPQGLLWCEPLLASEFESPPLVVLSACGSARGPSRVGDDGLARLGGAFLDHGALAVVQASGDLALEPTLALMEGFTRSIAAGACPAEALRQARVEFAGRADLAHPFYTAGLRVVGLGFERVQR